ncbi:MAG: penicillin acylase family protein, partial [Nitrososphaerota archaeon]|nr:penicillin acylase family protein [Nitrososphaerota archaeon]
MKLRWAACVAVLLLLVSYGTGSFTLLSPGLGVWSSIDGSALSSGTVTVQGLGSPVNVTIDASGLAHISASNAHDLFYAQGYYSAS